MARITEEENERLRRDVSLERLIEARGVELRRDDDKLVGVCPFHEGAEHTLVVDPEANTWICPECAVIGGTVIDWIMKAEGISRRHAVELLRADHGGSGTGKVVKNSTRQKLPDIVAADVDDAKLLEHVVTYYADTLKKTPTAIDSLRRTGITGEAIERFRVGLSDRTLGYRLPKMNRKAGAEIRGRLHGLGILRETGHERLRGCITVPLFNEHGAVVSVYGRRLDDRAADLYVNTKGLFNIQVLKNSREIVVCSSVFDAVIMWCNGVHAVTAVHESRLDDLVSAMVKHAIGRVTICFPRTDEEQKKTEQFKERLSGTEVEVFRALLPSGMNVHSFIVSSASSPSKALTSLLRQAEWIGGVRPTSPSPATSAIEPPMTATAPTSTTTAISATTPTTTATPTPTHTGDIILDLGDRRWRIRGLGSNLSYERLRVHIFVSRETKDARTSGFFVDTLELYSARQRNAFVEQAAEELGLDADVVKRDLGHVLLRLEALQEEQIQAALQPKNVMRTMTDAEQTAAMDLLRDPKLVDHIVADFDRLGVVGESSNKLIGYLVALSRKLPEPLAVLVQSSSAAGKTSLVDAVLALVPEEDRVEYSAMTGQALYYVEPDALRNKVLAIAEEAGAQRAGYALKLLQSEGALTIGSTAKEAGTGRLVTHSYRVQGPVALMMTTTATEIDDELLNRCIVLSINEGREQTRAIHQRQRDAETLEGILARQRREAILQLHRNAQRLLRPVVVVNPFAPGLSFQDGSTRARRDHRKYLTLIRTVSLLHQHQRETKRVEHDGGTIEYIEVVPEDIAVADRLMADTLGTTDELPPHTRHVLGLLDRMVKTVCEERGLARADYRFTRRAARERLGLGGTQLWLHLRRLVEAEYVVVHPSRHGRGVVYELAVEGVGSERTSPIDRGDKGANSGDVRPSFGPDSGEIRGAQPATSPEEARGSTHHVRARLARGIGA